MIGTGQDSLAEEFPLSGRNGIQFRPVEVQRFRGSDCSLDPLESYPIIPMEESTLVFFLSFFFFPPLFTSLTRILPIPRRQLAM